MIQITYSPINGELNHYDISCGIFERHSKFGLATAPSRRFHHSNSSTCVRSQPQNYYVQSVNIAHAHWPRYGVNTISNKRSVCPSSVDATMSTQCQSIDWHCVRTIREQSNMHAQDIMNHKTECHFSNIIHSGHRCYARSSDCALTVTECATQRCFISHTHQMQMYRHQFISCIGAVSARCEAQQPQRKHAAHQPVYITVRRWAINFVSRTVSFMSATI